MESNQRRKKIFFNSSSSKQPYLVLHPLVLLAGTRLATCDSPGRLTETFASGLTTGTEGQGIRGDRASRCLAGAVLEKHPRVMEGIEGQWPWEAHFDRYKAVAGVLGHRLA